MSVFNESGAKIYASAIVTGQQLKSSEMSYALCSMAQYIVSLKGLEAEKQLYIDKLVEDKQKVQLEYETLLDQFKDLNTEGKKCCF